MKVEIFRQPWHNGIFIAFFDDRNGKRFVAKPVELEFEEITELKPIKPTLHIPYYLEDEFLKSFAESLDHHGIKTENDFKIKGTLDATKYHLEDLRKLLKL